MNTQDAIKREARKLFSHKGFDAASVRDITRAARANLGAVTYHFGSKQALYHAILDEVFEDLAVRVEAAGDLRAIVGALFAFFRDAPDAPLLVLRELTRGPPPAPMVPRVRRVLAAITAVIRAGQRRGELRDVEPFLGAFTLISQCVWFAVVGPHMPVMLGLDVPRDALARRVEAHIGDVVSRALTATAGRGDAGSAH